MELFMDDKWKLSKKGGCRNQGRRRSVAAQSTCFSRRCASLVKEQRARFYIMRRCVVMLVCWRDYS
ncbi:hypothetical protein Cni_G23774 [Canna indica]|uniref:ROTUNDIFOLIA like 8 n=1 Tax=Canna indica TaxID=4628 RepID=A0AAQ3KXU0_9LILI|nr:hypothetical protein Cni_G23774 [Canna indica]